MKAFGSAGRVNFSSFPHLLLRLHQPLRDSVRSGSLENQHERLLHWFLLPVSPGNPAFARFFSFRRNLSNSSRGHPETHLRGSVQRTVNLGVGCIIS